MIRFEQQDGPDLLILKLIILDEDKEIGFYLLVPQAINIYEVHTHIEPEAYGSVSEISKQALRYVFEHLKDMDTLVTKVPISNLLAKKLSLSVGMRQYGILPNSFNGEDQELFYINRENI